MNEREALLALARPEPEPFRQVKWKAEDYERWQQWRDDRNEAVAYVERVAASGAVSDLVGRAHEEYDALGLMSYHGVGEAGGDTMWRADLGPDDIDGIRALIRELGEALERAVSP